MIALKFWFFCADNDDEGNEWHRFDGRNFLQKFRDQKIMFVGDSLSNNQWQSLACMLHFSVLDSNYTLEGRGPLITLSFPVCFELPLKCKMILSDQVEVFLASVFLTCTGNFKYGRILGCR